MKKPVLAWESEEARENSGRSGWVYKDRPVKKDGWEKVRDHPVPGLGLYRRSGTGK